MKKKDTKYPQRSLITRLLSQEVTLWIELGPHVYRNVLYDRGLSYSPSQRQEVTPTLHITSSFYECYQLRLVLKVTDELDLPL